MLAGLKDNSGGFLIIPTLFSDVTIVTDAATYYAYVLNYSHADVIQLQAHTETSIGVTETEDLDPEDNNSPTTTNWNLRECHVDTLYRRADRHNGSQ